MILLQAVTFLPSVIYNIAGFLMILIGLIGSFFNLKNKISLLENEKENMKETIIKLEARINNSESKIQAQLSTLEEKMDARLNQVYDKIEKLPQDLSTLFKNIMGKTQ